jgi:hypothetical protein
MLLGSTLPSEVRKTGVEIGKQSFSDTASNTTTVSTPRTRKTIFARVRIAYLFQEVSERLYRERDIRLRNSWDSSAPKKRCRSRRIRFVTRGTPGSRVFSKYYEPFCTFTNVGGLVGMFI